MVKSGFSSLTQVCWLIRHEYIPFLLANIQSYVQIDSVALFALHYGPVLKHCQTFLRVICSWQSSDSHINVLPLLLLAIDMPGLEFLLESGDYDCLDEFCPYETQNLNKLIELSCANTSWQTYLLKAARDVRLYRPNNRCNHEDFCDGSRNDDNGSHDAWLHITITQEHKQLWMSGTHSFEELGLLLAETGLDGLTTIGIRVEMTSMKNKGYGKGLRTKEEQQTVDWMLGRSKKRPNNLKPLPMMLRALEY